MTFGSELHVSIAVWSVFVSSVSTAVAVCLSRCSIGRRSKEEDRGGGVKMGRKAMACA